MNSSKPFIKHYIKKLSGWVILLLLLCFGSIFIFGTIVHEVLWEKEEEIDHYVFTMLSRHIINGPLTQFMEGVSFFASSHFLQVAYSVLILFYLVKKNIKRAVEIGIIGLGGYAINVFMKWLFRRPRPDYPLTETLSNYGFPSGHAMSGFIFYGLLTYLIWKTDIAAKYKWLSGTILVLFSLLIGFSRIYLRVHYLSDVVAGFCIGFAWLIVSIWLMEKLKKKSARELKQL